MKKLLGRLLQVRFAVLLIVLMLSVLVVPFVHPPKASADSGLDRMCVPNYSANEGDHWSPAGWLTVTYITRFQVRVEYKPNGNCKTPPELNNEFIHENKQNKFADLVNGIYVLDSITQDQSTGGSFLNNGVPGGTDNYTKGYVLKKGATASDDSRIDEFNWEGVGLNYSNRGPNLDGINNFDTYRAADAGKLGTLLSSAEWTAGIEKSAISGPTCSGDTNFHLANLNNDGAAVKWSCLGGGFEGSGAYIRDVVANPENFNITYGVSSDGSKVFPLDGNGDRQFIFTWCNDKYVNGGQSVGDCAGTIVLDGVTQDELTKLDKGTKPVNYHATVSDVKGAFVVAGPNNEAISVASAASGAGNAADLGLNCSWTINPLTWLVCPMIEAASKAVETLDKEIKGRMTIDTGTNSVFNPDNVANGGQAFYTVWGSMRTIALSLLVAFAAIMIISQAISVGPFDAYTIRKVMPRLVIGVVAITMSFQLTKMAINVSNDLGHGVEALISTPFNGLGNAFIDQSGVSLGAIGLAFAAITTVEFMFVLSLALTAFAAVMIAFLTITFRNIFALLLVAFAPLAILAWILPNTHFAWKFWRVNFLAVLISFPIIVGFITMGRVFATLATVSGGNGLFGQLTIFIAYFGPYFALPAAFRLAGGAVATIGGVANDKSRGFFDRQKKMRGQKSAETRAKFMAGSRWRENKATMGINQVGRHIGVGTRGRFGLGATGRKALGIKNINDATNRVKNDEVLAQLANDDDSNAVLFGSRGSVDGARQAAQRLFVDNLVQDHAHGETDSAFRARQVAGQLRADRALSGAKAAGINRANSVAAGITMMQNKARAVGAGDIGFIQDSINGMGFSTEEAEGYAYTLQYHARNGGRPDLGGEWMGATRRTVGAGLTGAAREQAIQDATVLDGIGRMDAPSLMRGTYTKGIEQASETIVRQRGNTEDIDMRYEAARRALELHRALSSSTGPNADAANDMLRRLDIDLTGEQVRVPDEQNPGFTRAATVAEQLVERFNLGGEQVNGANMNARRLELESRIFSQEDARRQAGGAPDEG